jgi:anti-sigma regulatory factor (Ser/Thr protein kinase)
MHTTTPQTPSPAHDTETTAVWPPTRKSVAPARHRLRGQLHSWGLSGLADCAVLVLSELLTNALEHAGASAHPLRTRVIREGDTVRIEVHDSGGGRPQLRSAAAEDEDGRGLALVEALTRGRWGVSREGGGKTVWALVEDAPRAACGEQGRLPVQLVPEAMGYAAAGAAAADDVERHPRCQLEAHTVGDHVGFVMELAGPDTGAVWTRWSRDSPPAVLLVLPDCPATEAGTREPCCEYGGHPGGHTYELADTP